MLNFKFPFVNEGTDDDIKYDENKNNIEDYENDRNSEKNNSNEAKNSDTDETESETENDVEKNDSKNNHKSQENHDKKRTESKTKKIEKKTQFKSKKKNKNRKLNKHTIQLIKNHQSKSIKYSKTKNIVKFIFNVLVSTAQYSVIVGTSSFISYSLVGTSNNFLSNVLRDAIFSSTRIISDICTTTKTNYFQKSTNNLNNTDPSTYMNPNEVLKTDANYLDSILSVNWFTLNK